MSKPNNLSKSPDTIVATATAAGKSAIGIVRMSGPKSLKIASSIIKQEMPKKRAIKVCKFYSADGQQLDQGIAISFMAPQSFSGEDMVELHVHGNPLILDALVAACLAAGARHAEAGEFSRRAYQNGKMDLAQAESIADVINSNTEVSLRAAMKSLTGEFSKRVRAVNENIMKLRVYIEAALDFPTEEIDLLQDKESAKQISQILQQLGDLLDQAKQGLLIQEELNIVIIGKPNAGKSSLMNILCSNDRAIVNEEAGTTRDFLSERLNIQGMSVLLTDTAGIRSPKSSVEQEGIERSWQQAQLSDIIICIYDALEDELDTLAIAELTKLPSGNSSPKKSSPKESSAKESKNTSKIKDFQDMVKHLAEQGLLTKTIFAANKLDLLDAPKRKKLQKHLADTSKKGAQAVALSVKSGDGIHELMQTLMAKSGKQGTAPQFTARKRHIESLDKALTAVQNGHKQLMEQGAGELFAEDLKQATVYLDEILGKTTTDDLLDRIFSEFCLGK